MPRTIHRFQSPLLLLYIKREHVVLVVLPVSGCFPEFAVVHIGRDDWRLGYQLLSIVTLCEWSAAYLLGIPACSIRPTHIPSAAVIL